MPSSEDKEPFTEVARAIAARTGTHVYTFEHGSGALGAPGAYSFQRFRR